MSLSVKASVDLHRFLLSFILCGYSVMMNVALCSPSQVHGVCLCLCVCGCVLKVDEGVVINNDISRTRSNHCSLSLSLSSLHVLYLSLSSPSFHHSYYHLILVFIYLYSLSTPLCCHPLYIFFIHSWVERQSGSTDAPRSAGVDIYPLFLRPPGEGRVQRIDGLIRLLKALLIGKWCYNTNLTVQGIYFIGHSR